jgi:hypothetical protein
MSSLTIGAIVFACTFGGAVVGMLLRGYLSEQQLNSETKDVIKFSIGIIGTMAALVLGLLVGSAKATFDTQREGLAELSASVVYLDRVLAHYGPDAEEARKTLQSSVADMIERVWPNRREEGRSAGGTADATGRYEGIFDQVEALTPKTDAQRALQEAAIDLVKDIGRTRWSLFAHQGGSISVPFFVVVVLWFTLILAAFGLFAPPNPVVVAALLVCSLVLSSAIFLISELDQPFHGIIQIPSAPLENALKELGK